MVAYTHKWSIVSCLLVVFCIRENSHVRHEIHFHVIYTIWPTRIA